MDIHRPKVAHSWREFLIEIGTIVCGILIALGLEQTIEAVRTGAEVREARAALREEVSDDAAVAVQGLEEDRCLRPQLDAFAAWARGGPKPPAFRTVLSGFRENTWDSVKAGAVPHMPLTERRAISAFYAVLQNDQKTIDLQRANALVIFGASEREALSREDSGRLLDAVASEGAATLFNVYNNRGLLLRAAQLGAKPASPSSDDRAALDWLCGRVRSDPFG